MIRHTIGAAVYVMVLLIIIIFTSVLFYLEPINADKIASPPPLPTMPAPLQHYLQSLWENKDIPEVTTTAPNNNRQAREGKLVIYNNSGTYELWVKTNVDSTDWQKI